MDVEMSEDKGFSNFRNFATYPQEAGDRLAGNSSFANFAWFSLFYNVLVIAWGVFLRSMGFGDGCGSNWPL